MTQTMTRLGLLDLLQAGHRRFKAFVVEISDEQLLIPGVIGVWSVKDILAHILVHEQRMIDWVTQKLSGKDLEAPQPYSMPEDELSRLNEQIYLENRDRPVGEVLADLDITYLQALAMIETAAEAGLFDPRRFKLRDGEPLWEAVAANTFWHYEEHERDIRAWLAH